MSEIEISTLLKQTTATKRKGGWKASIEFLISYFLQVKEEDKGHLDIPPNEVHLFRGKLTHQN